MKIIDELLQKKKTTVTKIACAHCGAPLTPVPFEDYAECPYCGNKCLLEKRKAGAVASVIGFVEKQQRTRFALKEAERKRQEEELEKSREQFRKYWWVYALIVAGIIAFFAIMATTE